MQTFIGFDEGALTYNRSYSISAEPPAIATRSNAFVSPIWATVEGNFLEEVAGGAFDASGRFMDEIAQPRSDGKNAIRPRQTAALPGQAPTRIAKAVFGGIAFDHFGHFLLEASTRLWCLEQFKSLPWLFLNEGRPALKTYQRDFLMLLGLSADQIVPVADWHLIDELVVPEHSFVYHHHATHAYRDTFQRAKRPAVAASGRRVFLSRINTTIALTVGERELESILAANGWDIVCPETLPAAAQAALFQNDNIVLGLQGSAMHLGLFAPPGRRVLHLCRGLGYRGYYLLDDLTQANATYLNAMQSHELESKPIRGPFLLDLDKTVACLRDQELVGPAPVSGYGGAGHLKEMTTNALSDQYAAWWHYTESQVRFHHLSGHDGQAVAQTSALPFALRAVALTPENRTILSHAVALLLKFEGVEAAGKLIEGLGAVIAQAQTPEDAELLYYISLIRDARADYVGALAAAQAAVDRVPQNAGYVNQLATVLFRLDRFGQADQLLRGIVDNGNAVSGNFFMLSMVARALHDPDAALSWAQRAVKADRNDEGACRHLANLYQDGEQPAEALATYLGFLERRPDAPGMLGEAIVLAQRLADFQVAAKLCLQAYRLDPDSADLARQCVDGLSKVGRLPALTALGVPVAPAVQEQSVMIYRHSVHLAASGSIDQALQMAMIAAELNPDNETIMSHLLGLMVQAKRVPDARVLANLLIERGKSSGPVYYVLSLIEANFGLPKRARDAARRAAELDPENVEIAEHFQRIINLEALAQNQIA